PNQTCTTRMIQAQWCIPVVPVTGEAEPAGSPQPKSSGLQCTVPSGHRQTLMLLTSIPPHLPGVGVRNSHFWSGEKAW
uniref:Uncharacterized protein n=1 Tax=Geospiza parvula TaxID=87175 RepID=A0A8C3MUV9_GEOPR